MRRGGPASRLTILGQDENKLKASSLAGLYPFLSDSELSPSRIIQALDMPVSLDQIIQSTRRRVSEAKRAADLRGLERRAELHVLRGFRRALETKSRAGVAVIAELKKASPSEGLIRSQFRAQELARDLESAGAAAL